MKIVFSLIAAALLISSGVMFFLVKKGAALRPAGVIAPAEIGTKPELIGQSIALRLFPEFQKAKNVIWYLDVAEEPYTRIPESTLSNYQTNLKPTLYDLRKVSEITCVENCWYVQAVNTALPEALLQKIKTEPSVEVYIQYFERDEEVSKLCENEKILEFKCVRPISVREVRKKIKTAAPYFFMRRYLDSQFYLFIEKSK
ncbi:MAG: hypothetical protein V4654_01875 [Bdellovibrionota bacterium]